MKEDGRLRLDKTLVERKLTQSRERAKELILKNAVSVNGSVTADPTHSVDGSDLIELIAADIPWVSRAGRKLEQALDSWSIEVSDKVVLDVGASTGGFTDLLLSRGAKKIYALDVGHGQLHEKLRNDSRVIDMEGTHIDDVASSDFSEPLALIVIDVSFISLSRVLPKVKTLLAPKGIVIALIKPQFEVGREAIKKGIVRDRELHAEVLLRIQKHAKETGFNVRAVAESPILGGDGNKEFLLYLN